MAAPVGPSTRSSNGAVPKGVVPAEWPAQAADLIVDNIAKVRDKTTKPAIIAARGLVYGLLAGVVGAIAATLLLVLVIRLWANYVPGDVWWLYLGLFVVFTLVGLVLLRKASSTKLSDDR